jgi:hygromycin-B 7''-O-kinase
MVNDRLVLRLNTWDRASFCLHNERLAYDLLAQQSLPVPRVLLLDDSRTLIPYDYVITTRLPGRTLASSWRHLTPQRRQRLVYAIGRCLARVHGCILGAFGKLHSLNCASWADYVHKYVEPYLRSARDEHLLEPRVCTGIDRLLGRVMGDWEDAQPALIHCDFHYGNVLHVDGRLSGILDFEWALAGDPAYDLVISHVRERMVPGSEAALIAGYQSVRPLGPNHQERVRCYQVIRHLERAVRCQRLGDSRSAAIIVERLRRLVEQLVPSRR